MKDFLELALAHPSAAWILGLILIVGPILFVGGVAFGIKMRRHAGEDALDELLLSKDAGEKIAKAVFATPQAMAYGTAQQEYAFRSTKFPATVSHSIRRDVDVQESIFGVVKGSKGIEEYFGGIAKDKFTQAAVSLDRKIDQIRADTRDEIRDAFRNLESGVFAKLDAMNKAIHSIEVSCAASIHKAPNS